jgi:PAS domain-containing protein
MLLFEGDNAAHETLRFAEEKIGFGLWQINFATGQLTCSPNGYRLLGLPTENTSEAEALSFSTFEAVAHPDDTAVLSELRHLLEQNIPFDREFRVIHRNGRVRSLAIHGEVLVDSAGKRSRAVGLITDVSSQSDAVFASRVVGERIHVIMESIGGNLWVARNDGQIVDYVLRELFDERTTAECLGKNWQSLIHPDDLDRVVAGWANAEEKKTVFIHEYRLRDPDGSYQWRRCYAAPLLNEDGSVREWVGFSLYIHQHRVAAGTGTKLITGAQVRAARGILNWSVRSLADRAGLSTGVVRRIEEQDELTKNADEAVFKIKDALSAGGVEFFVLPDGEAGVFPTRKENRLKIVGNPRYAKKMSA